MLKVARARLRFREMACKGRETREIYLQNLVYRKISAKKWTAWVLLYAALELGGQKVVVTYAHGFRVVIASRHEPDKRAGGFAIK